MTAEETSETIAQVPCGEYAVPGLEGVHGTIMFESARGHIHMRVDDGKVTLSPMAGKTDLVLRTEVPGALLGLVRGEINAVTAVLRGTIEAEGDLMLLIKVAGAVPNIGLKQSAQAPTQAGAE